LMGTGVGVHPILVLFGLLAGEEVAGVAGIFLSVPALAAALIIGRHLMDDPATLGGGRRGL
jgi:predicted PurR-regulated permease PerM